MKRFGHSSLHNVDYTWVAQCYKGPDQVDGRSYQDRHEVVVLLRRVDDHLLLEREGGFVFSTSSLRREEHSSVDLSVARPSHLTKLLPYLGQGYRELNSRGPLPSYDIDNLSNLSLGSTTLHEAETELQKLEADLQNLKSLISHKRRLLKGHVEYLSRLDPSYRPILESHSRSRTLEHEPLPVMRISKSECRNNSLPEKPELEANGPRNSVHHYPGSDDMHQTHLAHSSTGRTAVQGVQRLETNQHPALVVLKAIACFLGITSLFIFLRQGGCCCKRKRAERRADCEERRRARQYRFLARRHAVKAWFQSWRRQRPNDEEKQDIVDDDREAIIEKGVRDEILELRNAHDLVMSIVQGEQSGRAQHEEEARRLGQSSEAVRPRSGSLPDYRSTASSSKPPSYREATPELTEGTPSETEWTPESSVMNVSPRVSAETLRTMYSFRWEGSEHGIGVEPRDMA